MPQPIQLQILHAADQEGGVPAIEDAVNFSAVMNALEIEFPNTLKLSSGDIYIPGPFFNASNEIYGKPGIGDVLINNALGFQAVALGNHEFDKGTETIANVIAPNPKITAPGIGKNGFLGTQFPYLTTNLDFSKDKNLAGLVVPDAQAPQPNTISRSVVIEVGGEKIGIVGATTPMLPRISSPGDGVAVTPQNENDFATLAKIIQKTVDELTATGINKVILLAHMQDISIEEKLAELLKDVDLIIAGGSNTLLAKENDILRAGDKPEGEYPLEFTSVSNEPVLVVNTSGNYKYVGRLIVDFDKNGIISSFDENLSGAYATDDAGVDRVFLQDVDPAKEADPQVVAVVNAIKESIFEKDGNIFGLTKVCLVGTRENVRTEETNLGNLTADADLFIAQQYDSDVVVSIKNGGGIRDNIGKLYISDGDTLVQLPPAANNFVGKKEGQISQLDIENALRFNNNLSLVTVTAKELKQILEHSVAASTDGATPGRFPQVGGLAFSFDATRQPIQFNQDADENVIGMATDGGRIRSLAILEENGAIADIVVRDGEIVGNPDREIRLVTTEFLANGGDSYPFELFGKNRVDLESEDLPAGAVNKAKFTNNGSEQDALAEYLLVKFPADGNPSFVDVDTPPEQDTRIQNLSVREDTVLALSESPKSGVSPMPLLVLFSITLLSLFFIGGRYLKKRGSINEM